MENLLAVIRSGDALGREMDERILCYVIPYYA